MDAMIASLGLPSFVLLGLAVGLFGTLVGAGGGFILVPLLLFLLPHEDADRITAISMAVVFFNALSGTVAYARMRRVDFRAGWRFALAALPGAVLGAVATSYVSRLWFDRALGSMLAASATFLLFRTFHRSGSAVADPKHADGPFVLDAKGMRKGIGISSGVGFLSSALGIGGGIAHVPALVFILGYPVHIATATSHFVLACTTLVAVIEHAVHGSYAGNIGMTAALSVGPVLGAQVGARLSKRVNGRAIVVCLSLALFAAGVRIVLRTF